MIKILVIATQGQGLYEITSQVAQVVHEAQSQEGLCTIFVRHTSASLIIQENADPSAKRDLEAWLTRHVPENDQLYTHTTEGPDDMPSHIKSVLTNVSFSIPVQNCQMLLGTWQGIYLWEHRDRNHHRQVVVQVR